MRRVRFLAPCRFVCAASSSGGQKSYSTTPPASQFPYGIGSFERVFAPTHEFWYIDRTDFIPKLEALNASAIVSLKNRRMGKTLWQDTLVHYYDVAQRDKFKEHFGHLAIGKAPTQLANTFHVLPVTFAGLKTDTVEEFKMSLNDTLNDSFATFKKRYSLSFEKNEQNALSTFQRLVEEVQTKNEKLYVVIDEYDVSINKALGNRDFVSALRVLEGESRNPLKRMENIYAEFFSRIKTACDKNVARCFITGVTPLALNEFTSGFNIATHITNDLRFASLYGFTETDVRSGLARFPQAQLNPDVVERIVGSWRRNHNGYHFDPRQKVALYNPTRVLYGLRQLEEILQSDPPPSTLPPEVVADYLLSRISDDSNSMPAETTLEAIKSNPHASLVIAEALSSDNAELECAGGVKRQFRLSYMNELSTDRKPLLSFMFYNGALTYVPMAASEVRLKHSLRIPNDVAREEFLVELQRMIGLDASGYNSLRNAIVTMLDKKEIDSFCTVVSQFLLGGLDGRDVLGGEDPFAQAIYDALSLARRPGDCVKKEYKVDPKVRAAEKWGPAIDIAYITQVPQQCYCFSLKNVPLRGLDNWKTESTWETLVKISRDQIDDEGPSTVRKLRLADRFSDNNKLPRGATVQTVLDEAVKEARTKYLPPLRTEVGESNVHCWVLVRVGLRKLLWEKVV